MKIMTCFLAFSLAALLNACSTADSFDKATSSSTMVEPQVTLEQGHLQGKLTVNGNSLFAGIPFAAPPIGDLRWKAPQKAPSWQGIRDGSNFGAECMQAQSKFTKLWISSQGLPDKQVKAMFAGIDASPKPSRSEDCLFLNVRTGNIGGKIKQPVLVWLHGGSHQNGSGSKAIFQSDGLIDKGVLVVTVNYRLGAFGYMAHPELSAENKHGASGNYGIMDQIAALQWVQANIAEFGGDPSNVTLFGESAGGQAVSELMASPLATGLYHKAIMQSGVASVSLLESMKDLKRQVGPQISGEAQGQMLAIKLGTKNLTELRALPANTIIAGIKEIRNLNARFLPVSDGYVLPKTVAKTILDGEMSAVPILLGYNADEGTLFYNRLKSPSWNTMPMPEGPEARLAKIHAFYRGQAQTLIDAYGLADPLTQKAGEIAMLGDDMFGQHTRLLAKQHVKKGNTAYVYFFNRKPALPGAWAGSSHGAEISFVFDSHFKKIPAARGDAELTEVMGTYWTNFAKNGNPNSANVPNWPSYNASKGNWQILGPEIDTVAHVRKEKLDALEKTITSYIEFFTLKD